MAGYVYRGAGYDVLTPELTAPEDEDVVYKIRYKSVNSKGRILIHTALRSRYGSMKKTADMYATTGDLLYVGVYIQKHDMTKEFTDGTGS